MLSQGWSGHGDVRSSRATLPMRYSKTGQQTDHPLRAIRMLADEALRSMSMQLERLYSRTGRLSIPPKQLPRALLFQVLCRVRSEQLRMEEPDCNPLFRCSVGLNRTTRSGIQRRSPRIGTGCRPARLRRPSSTQSDVRPVRRVCPPTSNSPSTGTLWEPVSVSAMTRTRRRTAEIDGASDRLGALAAQRGRSYRYPQVTDRVPSDEEPPR